MRWVSLSVSAGAVMIALQFDPAFAESTQSLIKSDEIEKVLTPKLETVPAPEPVERTRSMRTRGNASFAPVPIDRQAQRVNLNVEFDLNSDSLTRRGEEQLDNLATAVLGAKRKTLQWNPGARPVFGLIGHTDARGSDDHNDELSRRRALAVQAYLVAKYDGLSKDDFVVDWKGKRQPKVGSDPFAEENRRVEVTLDGVVAATGGNR